MSCAASTVHIRPAQPADLPDVLRLYRQPELDDGRSLPLSEAIAIWEKIQQYPSYRIFVAERDRQIVGTFALLVMDNLLHLGAATAVLEAVAVDPQYHGQGIGQDMMHRAIAEARQAHCYKLMLSSSVKRDRAHAFYAAMGFTLHGYSFAIDLTIDPTANTSSDSQRY